MRQDKDRSSKWLFGHHGDSILHLAGVTGFQSCRAVQAEVVAPRRLPDGLLDVTFPGDETPTSFLVEIVSYADRRDAEDYLWRRPTDDRITVAG